MKHVPTLSRRTALGAIAGAVGALTTSATAQDVAPAPLKGRIKQSVCRWCYSKIDLGELATHAKRIGLQSIELLNEDEWPVVQKHGLTCAMTNGPSGINRGWNRPQDHDDLVAKSEALLPKVANAGLPAMIVFSGNRDGLPDDEGIRNCAQGLKRIMPLAEQLGVNVCMELLNSKRNHKDYQCDYTPWGVSLVQEVASPRFKLLYDIYHMQIMEGDVIATIEEHHEHIAHYHTGGVPGRHEIDETQELYYPRIVEAILATGYTGYLGQEFIPARDPIESLEQGVRICDV
jgi:hydroxypyruvate isomerase